MTNAKKTAVKGRSRRAGLPGSGLLALMCLTVLCRAAAGGTDDAVRMNASEKRDPFWPVGYMPKRVVQAAPEKKPEPVKAVRDWSGAMQQVKINGVSSKGHEEFYAVVNGELKSVGETFSVEYQGAVYTWEVASIEPPGSVRLRRVSVL